VLVDETVTLGVETVTLGVETVTLGVETFTLGVETFTLGVETFTPGVGTFTLGVETFTLGVDRLVARGFEGLTALQEMLAQAVSAAVTGMRRTLPSMCLKPVELLVGPFDALAGLNVLAFVLGLELVVPVKRV
jgi:hypothetical protein